MLNFEDFKKMKNKTLSYISIFLSISIFTISVNGALAAVKNIPSEIPDLQEQIDITVTPENPSPGQTVNISVDAYGTDLNHATISWTIDGKLSKSEKGARMFNIVAKKAGSPTTISIKIEPEGGLPILKTFTLNPQNIDIIWQAKSYTPPFYKGKALFTPQEEVKIVAMPDFVSTNGQNISPKIASYKWTKDIDVLGDESGYNAQSMIYRSSIFTKGVDIGVEASTESGLSGHNILNLKPGGSEMVLYENHPLYGILFNNAIVNTVNFGEEKEKTIQAIPYYFDTISLGDSELVFNWTINGETINVPPTQNQVTFRNSKDLEGEAVIRAQITNNLNVMQSAQAEGRIEFTKSKEIFTF